MLMRYPFTHWILESGLVVIENISITSPTLSLIQPDPWTYNFSLIMLGRVVSNLDFLYTYSKMNPTREDSTGLVLLTHLPFH